jgi:succinate-semialdehyde dehydrogenase/glutarate-semialdehyde dehydrogenase
MEPKKKTKSSVPKTRKKSVIEVFNPTNDKKIGEVKSFTADEAKKVIEKAKKAQVAWGNKSIEERAKIIRNFRDILIDRSEEVSELISLENGKVLQESFQMEVFSIIDLAGYFADRAHKILKKRPIGLHLLKHRKSYLHYKPRGVVLVISPWNFPFAIPFGEVIMALLAGNSVVLKPASLTPLIAMKGRELFDEAGLEPDLFQVVPCPGPVASQMINYGIGYVNFTGSTQIGVNVSELCGKLLIPCSMELGGKDPAVVLPDADLNLVTGSLVWGAFANAGQVCASIERAYVHESIYNDVVERVVDKVKKMKMGDPLVDGTDMGPMTDPGQLKVVEKQVEGALKSGVKALTGGKRPKKPGQFYPPTVLVNVKDDMEVMKEETFGPTLPITKYSEIDEVINRANDSPYGLDAYVYGTNSRTTKYIAERLQAGTVMINETLITHACPETPWGGVKESGVGRVHSDDGLRDLCIAYHVNDEAIPKINWSPFWQPYSHKMYRALIDAARMLNHSNPVSKAKGAVGFFDKVIKMFKRED